MQHFAEVDGELVFARLSFAVCCENSAPFVKAVSSLLKKSEGVDEPQMQGVIQAVSCLYSLAEKEVRLSVVGTLRCGYAKRATRLSTSFWSRAANRPPPLRPSCHVDQAGRLKLKSTEEVIPVVQFLPATILSLRAKLRGSVSCVAVVGWSCCCDAQRL